MIHGAANQATTEATASTMSAPVTTLEIDFQARAFAVERQAFNEDRYERRAEDAAQHEVEQACWAPCWPG
jgi:hypothetical protein